MASIVAARFDSFPSARSAAYALFAEGFSEEAVNIFLVHLPKSDHAMRAYSAIARGQPRHFGAGEILGAALFALGGALLAGWMAFERMVPELTIIGAAAGGAYLGALAGMGWLAVRSRQDADPDAPLRQADVLLTVQVDPGRERAVAALLRDADGKKVERAHTHWTSTVDIGGAKDGAGLGHRPAQLQH